MSVKSESDNESNSSTKNSDLSEGRPRTFEALLGLLGASGRYQLMVLACLSIAKAFPGMVTLSHAFARSSLMKHYCDVNATVGSELLASCWSAEATLDQCRVTLNCTNQPGGMLDSLACADWTFDRSIFTETVASRFRLVCGNSYLADLATTGFFAGFLVGASLYGMLGDKFGRMPASLVGMAHLTLTTALAGLAPFYWLYALAMLLAGVGTGGLITVLYAAVIECTDSAHRLVWGFTINQGWSLGIFTVTLVAYLERNYQAQLLWLCATSLPLYLLLLLAGESARWLVTTGRVARADIVIGRAASLNRTIDKLPEKFSAEELYANEKQSGAGSDPKAGNLLDLFRTPGLRRATLLSWLHWFAASMTYYGISLGADSIGGDVFLNVALVSAVEVPARFLGMLLSICRVGRKPVLYASFALSAVFLAAMVGVFEQSAAGTAAANVALAVLSKLSITVAFDSVWLYYSEMFPTVIRSAGVGSGSTMARVGAILSTQLLPLRSVWGPLPFVIFGVGPLLACLVIYFLPETVGQSLPETVYDGEQFVQSGGGRLKCCAGSAKVADSAAMETTAAQLENENSA